MSSLLRNSTLEIVFSVCVSVSVCCVYVYMYASFYGVCIDPKVLQSRFGVHFYFDLANFR